MKKNVVVMIVIGLFILTGCKKEVDYSIYPEHFGQVIREYDDRYQNRDESKENEDIYRCYMIDDEKNYFLTKTWGYEEDMLLGVEMTDHAVLDVDILYENESDKYGEYVTEDWFLERFLMDELVILELVKKQKAQDNEVVAITGATITSQAVLDGVNGCIKVIMEDGE